MRNLPTSPANPGASPDVIDRLFQRLFAMYGKAWLDMWSDGDVSAVKAAWRDSLANTSPEQMRLALDALAKEGKRFPPNLPEFFALCEQFRVRKAPNLYLAAPRSPMPANAIDVLRKALKQ